MVCPFQGIAPFGGLPLPGDCHFWGIAPSGGLPLPGDCPFRGFAPSGGLPLPRNCPFRGIAAIPSGGGVGMVLFLSRVAKPQGVGIMNSPCVVVGIEIDLSDKWRIHHYFHSSWRDFHCLMGSGNFNYERLGHIGIGQSLLVSRDWFYGSISSRDWFLALQFLQMIEKFLLMVPHTKFSLTIRQCPFLGITPSRD